MSRVQFALNVDDLDAAVTFYSKLFNTGPNKVKEGYANFAVADPPLKLVLLENPGKGGSINHLGVEVEDADALDAWRHRLDDAKVPYGQHGNDVWLVDPNGLKIQLFVRSEPPSPDREQRAAAAVAAWFDR